MIDKQSYTIEWIVTIRNKIGKPIDPKLIEKVIFALTLLEQLQINKLSFIFKGGTALLLGSLKPKRFSIDIDIISTEPASKIKSIIAKICLLPTFNRYEEDNNRTTKNIIPVSHYKVFYKSVIDQHEEPILLDVLHEENPYAETQTYAIKHSWLASTGEDILVKLPSLNSFLGDKLTAFAPKTTGVLYTKDRPVEIIKHLFDIGFLFDQLDNLIMVKETYCTIVQKEIAYRKLNLTIPNILNDTWQTCLTLTLRDNNCKDFKELQKGINNFTNFTIDRFTIEEAIIAAAKVAYLTTILQHRNQQQVERFTNAQELTTWFISQLPYSRLNKLKKNNPEAFYYWYQSFLIIP